MSLFPVRVGTIAGTKTTHREAVIKHVDSDTVKALSDDELANAQFYASIGRTDDRLVLLLRREQVRRLVEDGDEDGLHKVLDQVVFDAVGALFNHANLYGDVHSVTGYDDEGAGIEITIPRPGVATFD